MDKIFLFNKSYSLQINSLLIYKHILERKEVLYLQAIILTLAVMDRSIQDGGLFH